MFVATQPVDGRKDADSLMAIVRDLLGHDPLSGHFYGNPSTNGVGAGAVAA